MAAPQISRHDQLVRRLFNLKSGYSTDVADTVMPVVNVIDPADVSHSHARGESRVSGQRAQAGVAAQFSAVELMAGAGHIWVVTQLVVSTAIASTINLIINPGQTLSAQVNPNPVFRVDGRDLKDVGGGAEVQGKGAGVLFRETLVGVPGTGICASFNTPAGNPTQVQLGWVLFTNQAGVGTRIQIVDSQANDALTVWAQGYERLLEPSETF